MATISKRVLDDIRFRNDIVDVIGAYIQLQKSGGAHKALCPFHKEKTPSFHVNPARQIFHCFGCGAGGDVFKFVMQYEGVDFMGAVRMLAQRAQITLEFDERDEGGSSQRQSLYTLLGQAAAWFHARLKEPGQGAEAARLYLERRKLDADTVAGFQIGYAPDAWDALIRWGATQGHSHELLELAGLVSRSTKPESANRLYDRFRHRLMFPICDEQGRVIAFSGRILADNPHEAKYVNSPETPVFRKSKVLYALHLARRHIVASREALVCEGQIDVIRCHQAGFPHAVASQGTAFTDEHCRVLRRYADSVMLLFDSDKAGEDAAIKTAALFQASGLAVRVASLPKGEDPDSFIRDRGAAAFKDTLDHATSAVHFQVEVLWAREKSRSEIGAMRIARAVLQNVAASPDEVQRNRQLQELGRELNMPVAALHNNLGGLLRRTRASDSATVSDSITSDDTTASFPIPPPEEQALCEHLATFEDKPELLTLVREHLPPRLLSHPLPRRFVESCLEADEKGFRLLDVLRDNETVDLPLAQFGAKALAAPMKVIGTDAQRDDAVRDLILFIWRRDLKRQRAERRLTPGADATPAAEAELRQMTLDLKMLQRWTPESVALIRMHMSL